MFRVNLLIIFSLLASFHCEKSDYYWRDYVGDIPDDALPGGSDRNHRTTYIGQVHIPKQGVLPSTIHEGISSVIVSKNGIHTSDIFIQILCTDHPEKLTWEPTTAVKLLNDTDGKHMVPGGAENGKLVHIGRVSYQGEVIVGKICSYNVGNAIMYFPYRGKEIGVTSYEVLTYGNIY